MQDVPQHPLFLATKRLVDALNRLEGNLEQAFVESDRDEKQEKQLVFFERENEELREERENLNGAISQLKHQYNDLHKVASAIYGKLDDAIKRLTQIIEN